MIPLIYDLSFMIYDFAVTNVIASSVSPHQLWSSAWPAGLIMLGLGFGFAVVLLIASERLKVKVDPQVEQIYAVLPHVECGACGFAGCGQYAPAVRDDPQLLGKCAPGGSDVAAKIAAILNVQLSNPGPPLRPVVHCRAHTDDRTFFGHYYGLQSCTAVNALANTQACKFGCLAFGDCTRACKFNALHIVDSLATVDYAKCTGCAACSKTCPRNLIQMVPFAHENMMVVACSSRESGRPTREFCQVGCIGCGLCAKQCDAFKVEDNFARLDFTKYEPSGQTEAAYNKCPTGAIVYRGKSAPTPRDPKAKEAASARAKA